MIELLVELCLAAQPEVCVSRLLPGSGHCAEATAEDWAAARPELRLVAARCAPLETAAALPVTEVASGVFVHQGRHELPNPGNAADQANIGFVVGEDAVAVIDAGGSRTVSEGLYAAIRARTKLPIRWLILTHMHPDHVLGASVFVEAGATVIGHAKLPAALANRAESYRATFAREAGPALAIGSEIVLPDATVAVAEARVLDLGGRSLRIEAHPTAHTDNDMTVLDDATGTWFVGDLVFDGHLPTIDGSVLGWMALLDRLSAREIARIVPGHGPPTLPWPEGAGPMRAYFAALVSEIRAEIARGESLGEVADHAGAGLRGDWALFDQFNPRNATAAFRELEWE